MCHQLSIKSWKGFKSFDMFDLETVLVSFCTVFDIFSFFLVA